MNKKEFITKLSNETGYSKEKCILINDILEDNFFISKSNKEKIISEFITQLQVDDKEAENIYEISISVLKDGIKNTLKHPFRSKD